MSIPNVPVPLILIVSLILCWGNIWGNRICIDMWGVVSVWLCVGWSINPSSKGHLIKKPLDKHSTKSDNLITDSMFSNPSLDLRESKALSLLDGWKNETQFILIIFLVSRSIALLALVDKLRASICQAQPIALSEKHHFPVAHSKILMRQRQRESSLLLWSVSVPDW